MRKLAVIARRFWPHPPAIIRFVVYVQPIDFIRAPPARRSFRTRLPLSIANHQCVPNATPSGLSLGCRHRLLMILMNQRSSRFPDLFDHVFQQTLCLYFDLMHRDCWFLDSFRRAESNWPLGGCWTLIWSDVVSHALSGSPPRFPVRRRLWL